MVHSWTSIRLKGGIVGSIYSRFGPSLSYDRRKGVSSGGVSEVSFPKGTDLCEMTEKFHVISIEGPL